MRYEYNLKAPNFTAKNVDILIVSRGKNYKYSYRKGRTKHGFIYTVRGTMRDTFHDNGETNIDVKPGELVFIPQNCAYTGTYLEEDTEIKIIQFDLAEGVLPHYLTYPHKIPLPEAGERINAFFRPGNNHPFYYLSCLYELLWQIDSVYSKLPSPYKKLQAALTEIAVHYADNRPINEYATLCGMSEVNFRRLFHKYTGKSPIQHRNDIRLEKARILLQSGEYNVSEAAEACGFSSLSFFIRLYKKKYGYTPKKE